MADETRFRLLRVLVEADTALCLPELVDIVRRPQYAVSRAMAVLARTGLVEAEIYLRRYGGEHFEVYSAGLEPGT